MDFKKPSFHLPMVYQSPAELGCPPPACQHHLHTAVFGIATGRYDQIAPPFVRQKNTGTDFKIYTPGTPNPKPGS
jgi:hypothetical protein